MVSECHSIARMVDAGRQIGGYPIRQYKLRRAFKRPTEIKMAVSIEARVAPPLPQAYNALALQSRQC